MSKEGSELAKLLRQINAENEAAHQALHGLAQGAAQHEFITARMERMGKLHEELELIVGHEEAARLIVKAMERKEEPKK